MASIAVIASATMTMTWPCCLWRSAGRRRDHGSSPRDHGFVNSIGSWVDAFRSIGPRMLPMIGVMATYL